RVRQPHSSPAPRPSPGPRHQSEGTGGTSAPSYQPPATQPQRTDQSNSSPQPTQTTGGDSTTQPPPKDGGERDGGDVSR
ncbi:MAG: hypothetical protein ACJ76V_08310, partial [Thermoleophilaceae bacterium]